MDVGAALVAGSPGGDSAPARRVCAPPPSDAAPAASCPPRPCGRCGRRSPVAAGRRGSAGRRSPCPRAASAGPPARALNGFAPVSPAASGTPRRPTIRWRFVSGALGAVPRSVGFLPTASPPFSPGGSRYRRSPATSRSGRPRRGDRGGGGGASARPPPRPSRAVAASRSSRSRSPTPAAGVPRGSRPAHIEDPHQRRAIRHARAAPLGLGGSGGSNDRIAARRSSVTTSCALMPGDRATVVLTPVRLVSVRR